jgi:hypothetical protein
MRKFFHFIKIFYSININKAKAVLKNTDPLKRERPSPTDNRIRGNLNIELRKGKAISFTKYLRYRTLVILSNRLSKEQLRFELYDFVFFLLYWIERLDEVENDS